MVLPRNFSVMDDADVSYLDTELLDDRGRMRACFAAQHFRDLDPNHLKLWCHKRARYGIPTLELVGLLKKIIGSRSAIEIGAGNGDLGYMLGITETDSYIQQLLPELWRDMMQEPTKPSPDVIQCDALTAIQRFRPQVVVASWFTRKFIDGRDVPGRAQASAFGEREEKILEKVETYIHVGHVAVHGEKTLLKKRHKEMFFPELVSRHADQKGNRLWVWENTK